MEKDRDRCKILLLFRRNPYFRNDVVVKEYLITLTGLCRSVCRWAPETVGLAWDTGGSLFTRPSSCRAQGMLFHSHPVAQAVRTGGLQPQAQQQQPQLLQLVLCPQLGRLRPDCGGEASLAMSEKALVCSPGVWDGDPSCAPPDLLCAPYQYICDDLWCNPLKYYGKKMAASEGPEERTDR